VGRRQTPSGGIEEAASFGSSKPALQDLLTQFAVKAAIERAYRGCFWGLFLHGKNQKVGLDGVWGDISESGFQEIIPI
jgi:hypothetical protein